MKTPALLRRAAAQSRLIPPALIPAPYRGAAAQPFPAARGSILVLLGMQAAAPEAPLAPRAEQAPRRARPA